MTAFRRAALEGVLPDGCAVHSYQGFLPYVAESFEFCLMERYYLRTRQCESFA